MTFSLIFTSTACMFFYIFICCTKLKLQFEIHYNFMYILYAVPLDTPFYKMFFQTTLL
jgi:hypothetical protein